MAKPKLRVGLLLDDMKTPSWAYEMIETIRRSDYAEICLIVMPVQKPPGIVRRLNPLARIRNAYQNDLLGFTHKLVRKGLEWLNRQLIERRTYLRSSEEPVELHNLLHDVPRLEVAVIQTKWSDSFAEADLHTIRGNDLDILVRLGFRILRGGVLTAARHGIWSFHHGDNRVNRGGPPGFWETMESWPETGSILQILSEDVDNGSVLYRSFSCTHDNSVRDNKSNYYWKSSAFIPRKLQELQRDGAQAFFASVAADNAEPDLYSRRLYRNPGNFHYAKLLVGKLVHKIATYVGARLFLEQWILLIDLRATFSSSLWRYKRIVPPKDRFWADPHAVQYQGRYFIFIEEWLDAKQRGHISLIEVTADGNYTTPVPIIERDFHLSYPFVFEYEGMHYMIPETANEREVQLYRATEFPFKWEFQYNLIVGIKACDSTLLFHNAKWWLFATVTHTIGMSSWDELHVFHADSPLSQNWQPHRANPVVSDCKSARPAGRFFEIDGRIYRPSQNCARRYGYGFNLARIDCLDENTYAETIVTRVEPNWEKDLLATHSFSKAGMLHVIDAQIRRWK